MPELPEVEATRRHLDPLAVGKTITRVRVTHPRMLRRQDRPSDFVDRIVGRRIVGTGRHGKHLFVELEGEITWVMHLGMSGRVSVAASDGAVPPHTHVVVELDDGTAIRFTDPRTFGYVCALTPDERLDATFVRHGPDALTADVADLAGRLVGRTAAIKALLCDQTIVSGIGNIYADEALHRARLSPFRPGGSLDEVECGRLVAAIHDTLDAGLAAGGTTLDDLAYLLPDGRAGDFSERLAVYGREGEPCHTCGTPIRRAVLRGRSTHWCDGCQA